MCSPPLAEDAQRREVGKYEVMTSPFTDKEIEYLRGQRLGRMATSSNSAPHIVPVGFRLDATAQTIQIGGHGLSKSKKWRDLQANPKIAFSVDDLASVDPWTPRGIEIRGTAQLHDDGGAQVFGDGWDSVWFAVIPRRIISWGIEGPAFSAGGRSARSVNAD
ncbi:MAG TPA: PPOX class F420-dependent oxidoreductase [Streptosporangiaceae bacterium]|jgi:pyridoxamine 5'-phosphate oxidase family protein